MELVTEFRFSTENDRTIGSFDIYVTDSLVQYEFSCTLECKIHNKWVTVSSICSKQYTAAHTICKSIFIIRIPTAKVYNTNATEWKVVTSLPAWKVNRFVVATGSSITCQL